MTHNPIKCCTRWIARGLLGCFAAMSMAAQARPVSDPPLYVGAAKIDITPSGAALAPGKFVRDPLFVRVIYLKSGSSCALLVGIDKALVATATVAGARARLRDCASDNVFISATHTHSAEDLPNGWMAPQAIKQVEDAIVQGALEARSKAKRARMGFSNADLHLNVNRDAFDGLHWFQGSNPAGVSDKNMSVLYFVDESDMPIAMMMNYGMHPINFFLSGVVSADFPGEASRYVERRYAGAVALFTQAASGDQNPLLSRPLGKLLGPRLNAEPDDRIGAATFWEKAAQDARERPGARSSPAPAYADWDADYRKRVAEVGEIVTAMGAIMGETAIEAMRDRKYALASAVPIWSRRETVTCPGRDRVDMKSREGVDPGYRDGAPVNINVGLLTLGDVAMVSVDSEVYTEIVQHLKQRSPFARTMVVGLAGGLANSGYIYSDNAAYHLTFEVIGSRLKPGCAERGIIDAALRLMKHARTP